MLTSYSDADKMRPDLYYGDPAFFFDHCQAPVLAQRRASPRLRSLRVHDRSYGSMSDVVLFGLGDFARVARVYLDVDSAHRVVAFTANERYIESDELDGLPVVPFESLAESHPPERHPMFVAIGFSGVNRARREVYEECKERGYELITYVNSKATTGVSLRSATTALSSRRT